ncbi:MAG: glycine/sarcosine/betaine reductase selenoprotein B family protein [Acidobacteriota bacterium]
MARFSDLRLKDRIFMSAYRYRSVDWQPGARLIKPLCESRLALVTTAALYAPDQEPFDEKFRGGDFSYRVLDSEVDLASLRMGHRSLSFDHSGVEQDPNLALPLDRFRELERDGIIGSLNQRHYSFMGSITAPGRLLAQTAPMSAQALQRDDVDAAFLTPV